MKKYTSSSAETQLPRANVDQEIDSVPSLPINPNTKIHRGNFPEGFVFGVGTSAYQHEGGAAKGGRGKTIWDDFTLRTPGCKLTLLMNNLPTYEMYIFDRAKDRIRGGTNGNVAADMYNRYKEDIKMMKSMGFDAYRFSISWTRILPGGRPCLGVNKEGIDFYNDIINTLIANGLEPFVTLFHFDLPHCLELEYGGFLCPDEEITTNRIVNDFREFSELCFWEFGDRVKNWSTLNEPWSYAVHGYVDGQFPPSKDSAKAMSASAKANKSNKNIINYRNNPRLYDDQISIETLKLRNNTNDSNSKPKDAYTVAKNLLLSHAIAVDSYRKNFKDHQRGKIGITLNCHWFEPLTINEQEASVKAVDFMLGWFLRPVLIGEYPTSMQPYVEDFKPKEKRLLQGSIDFLGLNYYTANYVAEDCDPKCQEGYYKDMKIAFSTEAPDGTSIGVVAGSPWLYIVPWGIQSLLEHISKTYELMPDIYITENGVDEKNDWKLTATEACADGQRINYHADHLKAILNAMDKDRLGSGNLNVKGYFVWSWCDNFEWTEGYTVRFGLIYVDYMNELVRYPKKSAKWFAHNFLNNYSPIG